MSTAPLDHTILWALIAIMGIGVYVFRSSFILIIGWIDSLPGWFERSLRFVPPAIFSALVIPAVFAPDGTLAVSIANPELIAGSIGAVVAWRTGNMFITILVGMAALGGLHLLGF